jgi:hypothetical protein
MKILKVKGELDNRIKKVVIGGSGVPARHPEEFTFVGGVKGISVIFGDSGYFGESYLILFQASNGN